MSRTKQRSRLDTVQRVNVKLRHLHAEGAVEMARAVARSAHPEAEATIVKGVSTGKIQQVHVTSRDQNSGRIVGKISYDVGSSDGDREVSVVDRENQPALRALSRKAEALVSHHANMAARRNTVAEVSYTIAENCDQDAVRKEFGLTQRAPPEDEARLKAYGSVRPGRDPSSSITAYRAPDED